MFIFRWLSIVLIVTAVMLLGADLVGTLEKKALVIRSLQNVFLLFNYDATQALVANFPPPLVRVSVVIVETPGWITFSLLAFVFAVIAPTPKPVRPLPPPRTRLRATRHHPGWPTLARHRRPVAGCRRQTYPLKCMTGSSRAAPARRAGLAPRVAA